MFRVGKDLTSSTQPKKTIDSDMFVWKAQKVVSTIEVFLKDSEFIELPDYWKDLVDTKTITVHLTPIGTYQYLYYTVAKNRIIVKNHSNLPTHCSYIVYGERKDGEPLIPEYEGNSPEDYPGKNDQYSIAGYHYDRRTL